jgi:hypothetical protein
MANKPDNANFFPDVPSYPSMGTFQPVYGKFDLTTYIQGASDYEIMAFLVGKYNACLEAYGKVTQLSTDTITAAHQLQDWINNWFDNLDVQQELNNKIDKMVADGSFGTLLHKTFDTQINQQTTNAVTAWLVANVDPKGSAVVVDSSLSIEGAAADAKEVGTHITPLVIGACEDCNFQAFINGDNAYFNWASGESIYARERFYLRSDMKNTSLIIKNYSSDPGGGTYFVYLNENDMKSANITSYKYTVGDNILAIIHLSGNKTQDIGYLPYIHNNRSSSVNLSTFFGSVNEFVAIGDSLTVGYTSKKDGTIIRKDYSHSWPHYIESMFGCKAYWSAHSGITSKAWINGVNGSEQIPEGKQYLISLGAKSLYFIALITNDSGVLTLGEPADIGTTADTFYRYYAEIISIIKETSPNAIIVCTGSPLGNSSTNMTNFENAIKYIVNQNSNTYYLDARTEIAKIPSGLKYASHWATPGYAMLANAYANLMDNLVATNPSAFVNIAEAELKTNPD